MGKGPTTRRGTAESKRDAVALDRSSARPIKEVARESQAWSLELAGRTRAERRDNVPSTWDNGGC